jgi:phage gp16-like protein
MKAIDDPRARRNDLAQIHIAVAALGWSEADYRAILESKTGKTSAAELDTTSRKRFLEHLRQSGWKPKQHGPKLTKQQWLVKTLWKQLGAAGALTDKSDAALNAFIKTQGGPDDLRFLGTAQAGLVIEALKGWLARKTPK